ncbi:MAG: hypothetical protein ACI9HK_003853 [Pirellulaceae bacterium]|jgi:hypothetical protein
MSPILCSLVLLRFTRIKGQPRVGPHTSSYDCTSAVRQSDFDVATALNDGPYVPNGMAVSLPVTG